MLKFRVSNFKAYEEVIDDYEAIALSDILNYVKGKYISDKLFQCDFTYDGNTILKNPNILNIFLLYTPFFLHISVSDPFEYIIVRAGARCIYQYHIEDIEFGAIEQIKKTIDTELNFIYENQLFLKNWFDCIDKFINGNDYFNWLKDTIPTQFSFGDISKNDKTFFTFHCSDDKENTKIEYRVGYEWLGREVCVTQFIAKGPQGNEYWLIKIDKDELEDIKSRIDKDFKVIYEKYATKHIKNKSARK